MMASNTPYVRFHQVQKSYDGETLVVKDFNLDIDEGEFVTMLGPSGSGKDHLLDDARRVRDRDARRHQHRRPAH